MKSLVIRRSIVVTGHPTSISCEDAFWSALKEIAKTRNVTVSNLVAAIDAERQHGNLSSAIRLFVLGNYRKQLSDRRAEDIVIDCEQIWLRRQASNMPGMKKRRKA